MTYIHDSKSGPMIDLLGDRYRLMATREQTGGALAAVEVTVGPGHGVPPHIDRNEAIGWYVIEGELTFSVEGKEIVISDGG